jgi:starch-binding outer membrane protein, SusD/RagB family
MNTSYGNPEKAITILKTSVFVTDWAVLYSLYNPIVPPTQNYFTTGRLLLPIPQQEIDSNDKLKIHQNADY